MNYIHDLTEEQCKILTHKALLCCNSTHSGAESSSEPLLLFLLSDPRAKKLPEQYKLLLEPDVLRADQSGFFPVFDNEDPSEKDFSQFYSRLQYHISKVYSTSEFKQAEEKWKEWQNPITLSVSTKYSKRIQMEETKLDEDFINTQNTILKKVYTDRLLFIPDSKSRKGLYSLIFY